MTPQVSKIQPLAEQALLARAFFKQESSSQPQVGAVQIIAQDREIFCEGGKAD